MSLTLINEEYEGLPSLYANAGDWVDCQLRFYGRFDYTSNDGARVTYNTIAGNYTLTLPASDSWENYGFAVGDAITLTSTWVYFDGTGTFSNAQSWARSILYLSGNVMHISANLVASPGGGTPPVGEVANGREFPTDSIVNRFTDLTVVKSAAAEEIEFNFNLAPNGSTVFGSVLDGELMRFSSSAISGMALSSSIPLNQLGDQSGGYIKDVVLTWDIHDVVNHYRTYTLTYKILQWGVIENGFNEPDYYSGADHIAPIANIQLYGQTGNPSTILQVTSQNVEADTGGFNENYNGGVNNYVHVSTEWTDYLGDPIDGMDYSNESTFETFITATGQSINNSTFRIGTVFRPTDGSVYQSQPLSMAENLLVNAPEVDYMHSVTPDATIHPGFINADGVQLNITDIEFFISGSTLRVRGKIIPNAAAVAYFDDFPDGTRRMSMWVSIGNYLTDGGEFSERVNLLINDEDIIDAPTLGVQIPDMVGTAMYDHANRDAVGTDPRFESTITTEDDVRYDALLRLVDNVEYEGMRLKLSAYNATTGDEFTLEETLFSFSGVPEIAGQFQPNFTIPRNFNLPPTTDRNVITLMRDPSIDVAGKYGIQVCYGFLSRWEYWLEQLNVDNDFFNVAEPNDGKNKNWQNFSDNGDWDVRVSLFTIVAGVEDFDYHTFKIRPYEDEDVTPTVTYTRLSDGSNPTSLVDDELMEVEAVLEWNAGVYELIPDTWAEATIEDYESGNRWVISSVLAHGGVVANPLEPIPTSVGLDLVIAGNIATLKFRIDTNKVNVDQVSLTYRISSNENLDKILTTGEEKFVDTGDTKVQA
jgi:hypothetical protein